MCFLWDGLDINDLEYISEVIGQPENHRKGDELYRNGSIGILNFGSCKIYCEGETGGDLPVRTIKTGDIFGAASLFGNWEGQSHVIASEICSVSYINQPKFKEIIHKCPSVAEKYIIYLSDRIRFLNRRISTFTANSTEKSLIEFFYAHCDNDGVFFMPYKMSEFARRINIGRTSLYRGLDSLSKQGLLCRDGNKFTIKIKKEKEQ